jgi:hypothetical protein
MRSTTGTDADGAGPRQAASHTSRTHQVCRAIALLVVAIFLTSIARFYHPATGFTALIGFPEGNETYEAPQLRAVPHYRHPAWASYDGQFYAQRALDPLVRDPRVDGAMDLAPFRARRILFSWTAYVAGLGRPAWILEAYALQNVVAWLLLAVLLTRWISPDTPRGLALWCACLFSHGMLWSVRFALLDGPSLLLTGWAIKLSEDGHPLASAAAVGANGLGRETNVLGGLAQPVPRDRRMWARLLLACLLVVLPLLLWEDYLRSIYRSTIFAGADSIRPPGAALIATVSGVWIALRTMGPLSPAGLEMCIVLPLLAQAGYIVARFQYLEAWWRVSAGYVLLMLVLDNVLWSPATGAITRVLLPLTVGFNILLAREPRPSRFWPWFAAGNLHLIPAMWVMPLF